MQKIREAICGLLNKVIEILIRNMDLRNGGFQLIFVFSMLVTFVVLALYHCFDVVLDVSSYISCFGDSFAVHLHNCHFSFVEFYTSDIYSLTHKDNGRIVRIRSYDHLPAITTFLTTVTIHLPPFTIPFEPLKLPPTIYNLPPTGFGLPPPVISFLPPGTISFLTVTTSILLICYNIYPISYIPSPPVTFSLSPVAISVSALKQA